MLTLVLATACLLEPPTWIDDAAALTKKLTAPREANATYTLTLKLNTSTLPTPVAIGQEFWVVASGQDYYYCEEKTEVETSRLLVHRRIFYWEYTSDRGTRLFKTPLPIDSGTGTLEAWLTVRGFGKAPLIPGGIAPQVPGYVAAFLGECTLVKDERPAGGARAIRCKGGTEGELDVTLADDRLEIRPVAVTGRPKPVGPSALIAYAPQVDKAGEAAVNAMLARFRDAPPQTVIAVEPGDTMFSIMNKSDREIAKRNGKLTVPQARARAAELGLLFPDPARVEVVAAEAYQNGLYLTIRAGGKEYMFSVFRRPDNKPEVPDFMKALTTARREVEGIVVLELTNPAVKHTAVVYLVGPYTIEANWPFKDTKMDEIIKGLKPVPKAP